jgi:hypothetical protein
MPDGEPERRFPPAAVVTFADASPNIAASVAARRAGTREAATLTGS